LLAFFKIFNFTEIDTITVAQDNQEGVEKKSRPHERNALETGRCYLGIRLADGLYQSLSKSQASLA
jgi:hypothetical protein